ncbi:large adhesin [Canicola haemoglobinophilus]|uniref:Large adhesin n=1 Tax=Canicola haemoglobinophilus TaxID=733 RepID=A0AB38HAM3_9PAST|nr:YadA-like family protein [Canicola haemoglobinophilus]STO54151.1 large adhesin [Canicola haemoglobinophilus]STO68684.1 large adhesin [Canicola haemoglobinophilus]
MNKIFRVIWSKTLNTFVVVSELATGQRKSSTNSAIKPSKINSQHNLSFALNPVTLAMGIFAKNKTALKYSTIGMLGALSYLGATEVYANSDFQVIKVENGNIDSIIIDDYGSFKHSNPPKGQNGYTIALNPHVANTKQDVTSARQGADSSVNTTAVGRLGVSIGVNSEARGWLFHKNSVKGKENYFTITGDDAIGDKTRTWQDAYLGEYGNAVAVGFNTKAIGRSSLALGNSANAHGEFSVSAGARNYAGHRATAVGNEANASAHSSIAIGYGTNSSGTSATAIGTRANATSEASIAIGKSANSSNNYSIAVGFETESNGLNATAIGTKAIATGDRSVALGLLAKTNNGDDIAIGHEANASMEASIAIGRSANSSSNYSIAVGFETKSNGLNATAIGTKAIAAGDRSVALGLLAKTNAGDDIAIGHEANASKEASIAIGRLSSSLKDHSIAIGYETKSNGLNATAIGTKAIATGDRSVALGLLAKTNAGDDIAIGHAANASEEASIAIGKLANSSKDYAIAIGASSIASAANTIAIGHSSKATVQTAIAIGQQSKAEGDSSVSLGYNSSTTQENAIAIGYNTQSYGLNATAIGPQVFARGDRSVALGLLAKTNAGDDIAIGHAANASQEASIAIGRSAISSKNHSIAIGFETQSTDVNATAIGRSALAQGLNSLALGPLANVSVGGIGAISIGHEANTKEDGSIAIGRLANASKEQSIAIGHSTKALTKYGVAIGQGAIAGTNGNEVGHNIAIGQESYSNSAGSVAVGYKANVTNTDKNRGDSILLGITAKIENGNQAIAIGKGVYATSDKTIALGANANVTGTNSVAIGSSANVSGKYSIAFGDSVFTNSTGSVVLGRNAKVTNADKTRGDSVAIGTGANATNGNQVIALGKDAYATKDKTIAIGAGTKAHSNYSVAIGSSANVSAEYSIAIGHESKGSQVNATAIGRKALAQGLNSIALGSFANVSSNGVGAISIGHEAKTKENGSIAIGNASQALKSQSIALGYSAKALDQNSIALGNTATVSQANSIAIGNGANVSNQYSIAVGSSANVTGLYSVAIGKDVNATGENTIVIGNTSGSAVKNTNGILLGLNTTVGGQTGGNEIFATVAIGKDVRVLNDRGVAIGRGAYVNSNESVAIGSDSKTTANLTAFGYDPSTGKAYTGNQNSTWKPNYGEFAVGDSSNKTRRITGVAAGEKDTDAVNVAQLKKIGQFKLKYAANGNGADVFTNNKKYKEISLDKGGLNFLNGTNGNINASVGTDGKITHTLSQTLTNITSLQGGTGQNGAKITLNSNDKNINFNGGKLTNLAKGTLSNSSTDAITGQQLVEKLTNLTTALGGGAKVDSNTGDITGPSYQLHAGSKTGNKATYTNVSAALTALDDKLQEGITFRGDSTVDGDKITRKLGGEIKIVGDSSTIQTKVTNNGEIKISVKDGGINTTQLANSAVTNEKIKDGTITKQKLEQSVQTILDKVGTGEVASGNQSTVTGDKIYTAIKDAKTKVEGTDDFVTVTPKKGSNDIKADTYQVDLSQKVKTELESIKLKANQTDLVALQNKSFTINGDSGSFTRSNNENKTLDIKAGDFSHGVGSSSAVNYKAANIRTHLDGTTLKIGLRDDPTFSNLTISNSGPVLSSKGIDVNSKKITKLANGTDDTDAINKSQLNATVKALGGGAKIESNGNITEPTYNLANTTTGTTEYKDVGSALTALDKGLGNQTIVYKANGASSKSVKLTEGLNFLNGTHGNIIASVDSNGQIKHTLNQTLTNITSLQGTGQNSAKISLGSSDKNVSFNGGRITNVQDGKNNTDVATVGQLNNKADKSAFITFSSGSGHDHNVVLGKKFTLNGSNDITAAVSADGSNGAKVDFSLNKVQDIAKNGQSTQVATTKAVKEYVDTELSNKTIVYKAKGGKDTKNKQEVKLSDGLDFSAEDNLDVKVEADGKVIYSLAKQLTGIQSITNNGTTLTLDSNSASLNDKTLTGLADATLNASSKDAVSGKQLTDLATTLGVEVNTDNKTFKPKAFTKVEGGELNSGATNVTSAVEDLISAVNTGLKFKGNNASEVITQTLNTTLSIKGEGDTAPTSTAANNINVKANTTTNTLEIQLASNLTNLASVGHDANNSITFGNGGSATFKVGGSAVTFAKDSTSDKVKITGLADPTDNDGAATKQYVDKKVGDKRIAYKANNANQQKVSLNEGLDFVNTTNIVASVEVDGVVKHTLNSTLTGITEINKATGKGALKLEDANATLQSANDNSNITLSNHNATISAGKDKATIEVQQDSIVFKPTTGHTITINKDGKLTGLANATLNTTSTEAVVGKQLVEKLTNLTTALGGNATVNTTNGTITGPIYNLHVGATASNQTKAYNNVGEALTALDKKLLDGIIFKGDGNGAKDKITRKLGEEITIKGDQKNISVTVNSAKTGLEVKLSENLTDLVSIKTKANPNKQSTELNQTGVYAKDEQNKKSNNVTAEATELLAENGKVQKAKLTAGGLEIGNNKDLTRAEIKNVISQSAVTLTNAENGENDKNEFTANSTTLSNKAGDKTTIKAGTITLEDKDAKNKVTINHTAIIGTTTIGKDDKNYITFNPTPSGNQGGNVTISVNGSAVAFTKVTEDTTDKDSVGKLRLSGIARPEDAYDAVNKKYVDDLLKNPSISNIVYKATNATGVETSNGTVSLATGFNFTSTENITTEVEDNGVVKHTLNSNLTNIDSIKKGDNQGSLTLTDNSAVLESAKDNSQVSLTAGNATISAGKDKAKIEVKENSIAFTYAKDKSITIKDGKLSGLAPGNITNDSTDAISGSQLFDLAQKIGFEVNSTTNTTFVNPDFDKLKFKTGNGTQFESAPTSIFDALNKTVTLINKGFEYKADVDHENNATSTYTTQLLGSTLDIVRATNPITTTKQQGSTIPVATYSGDNLITKYTRAADGGGTFEIALKEKPEFKEITVKDGADQNKPSTTISTDGVKIADKNGKDLVTIKADNGLTVKNGSNVSKVNKDEISISDGTNTTKLEKNKISVSSGQDKATTEITNSSVEVKEGNKSYAKLSGNSTTGGVFELKDKNGQNSTIVLDGEKKTAKVGDITLDGANKTAKVGDITLDGANKSISNVTNVGLDANNTITFNKANGGTAANTTIKVDGSAVIFTKDNGKVKISNVATPTDDYDAANKKYVDDQVKEANVKLTNKVNEVDANRPFVFMLNENGKEVEVVKGRDGKLYKKDELKDATYQDGTGYMAKGKRVESLDPHQTANVTIAASKITPENLALSVGNVASGLGLTGNYTSGSKGNLAKPDAIDVANATTKITELVKDKSSFTGTALNKVATVGDLQAVAIAGLNFAGNTGANVHKKLTDTLAIVGNKTLFEQAQQKVLNDMGLSKAPEAQDQQRSAYDTALKNATKAITDRFSDKNVITTTDGKEISIKVAERPEFKGIDVTDPNSKDSVAIDPEGINIADNDGYKRNVIDKDGVSVNDSEGNSSSLSADGVNVESDKGSSTLGADNLSFENQDGTKNASYGVDGAELKDKEGNNTSIKSEGIDISDDEGYKRNVIDKDGVTVNDSDGNSSSLGADGVNVEGENGSSTLAAGKLSLTDQKGTDSVVINAGNDQHGPSIDFAHDETGKARGRINGLADITADETDGSIAANKNYVDARIKEATSGQPFEYATKNSNEKVIRGLDNKLYKESELNNYYYDSKEGKYKPKDASKAGSLTEIPNKDVIVNVMPKGDGKDPITIGNVESILGKDASTDKDKAASAIKQLIDDKGTLAEKKDNVATGSDVAALAKAGLDFGANVGDDIHKNLGEKVSIVGKDLNKEAKDAVLKEMGITDVPADGAPNKADYDAKYKEALAKSKKAVTEGFSAKNVATEIKNNQVVIKIADKPEFKALSITDEANPDVTTDLAPDGVVIADEQGNSHDVSVKGSVITDENGNSNSITATDVVLSSGDNESKLEAGKLTLAKSDGNNNNKVIVEVTDKGGKLTGLEARDVTSADYGTPDRAATESAVKKTYEDVKNGVLGPLVFTDKEGNRLVNVGGKYYKAKDVKADGTVDPKQEVKGKDAVLSLVHVGQSNTDPVVNPTVLNNVAPGEVSEHSKQAVNGAQLYQTNLAIQSNASRIDGLQSQINTVDKNMRAGVAQAVAQANLPQVFLPGKSTLSLATGHYMGTQAFAMGYSRVSDNGKVIVKFSLGHGDKQTSVGAGVGYTW